jgi:hypothetical protein
MSTAIIRNGSNILLEYSTLLPLRTDWPAWTSSFTVNAANIGRYWHSSPYYPYPYGWFFFGSISAPRSSTVFKYGDATMTTPTYVWGPRSISAKITLRLISGRLVWVLYFFSSDVAEDNFYIDTRKDATIDDPSPVGTYTKYGSYLTTSHGAYSDTGPYTVSA